MARNNVVPIRRKQRSPLPVYLETLAPSGRRSIKSSLKASVAILAPRSDIGRFDWNSLRYEDLVRVRFVMLNQNKSMHTVNASLAALRSIIKTAFHMGVIDADTMLRATAVKSVRGKTLPRGRALTLAEERQVLKYARTDRTLTGLRNCALLYLLLDTGLRREEAANLAIRDYSQKAGTVLVRSGKGRKQRSLDVTSRTATLLNRLICKMGSNGGELFKRIRKGQQATSQGLSASGIYRIVADLAMEAGIEHCTPHDLRRTFITKRLSRGEDLGTVSRKAGHQDLQTTLTYDRR